MPKATWGAGDNALTMADLDNAEVPEARTRYSGPVPPAGTYRWTLKSIKKAESQAGNDKLFIVAELDGDWKPNHKQYHGAPLFIHLALTKGNAPQVAQFLGAIGASNKDLMTGTIIDENGYITKLGRVGDPAGIQLYINAERRPVTAQYPDPSLQAAYGGYIMIDDDDDAVGADPDADDTEPPF